MCFCVLCVHFPFQKLQREKYGTQRLNRCVREQLALHRLLLTRNENWKKIVRFSVFFFLWKLHLPNKLLLLSLLWAWACARCCAIALLSHLSKCIIYVIKCLPCLPYRLYTPRTGHNIAVGDCDVHKHWCHTFLSRLPNSGLWRYSLDIPWFWIYI